MDVQTIINIVFGIGLPVVAWGARELYEQLRDHKQEFSDYKEKVAETYVTKISHSDAHQQLRDDIGELRDMLRDFIRGNNR